MKKATITETSKSALDHALEYASLGIPAIWIPRGSKAPIEKGWPSKATTDPKLIRHWEQMHPNCNFGLVMGNGFIAIDFDEPSRYLELQDRGFNLPPTRVHQTAKGLHLIYRVPQNLKVTNSVRKLPGIDVRHEGGQIVCPGSIHPSGALYKTGFADDDELYPIADLPAESLEMLMEPRRPTTVASTNGTYPAGTRANAFMSLGGSMRRRGMSQNSILAALREENKQCDPPMSDAQVRNIAHSVARYDPAADEEAKLVGPYSEHGLAERFAAENKDSVGYVPGLGWLVWDDRRWKFDDQGQVEKRCQQLCTAAASERSKVGQQNRIRSRRTREAVMREAQAHMVIPIDQLDKDPMLLNTPGGVVDLRDGKMRPARPEDCCTKLAGATPSRETPERWFQFLREITAGDKTLQRYLQRIAGYCMTGDVREQEMYFLYGSGANGKSVFVNALMLALNEYAKTAPSETLMVTHNPQHATSIAALRGARMVAVSEVEDGSRWAESKLKELTGGTPITARFMRQDEFTYMPQFKLVISGNHKPRLRNVDYSMVRRLRLVPFTVQIAEDKQDPELIDKLTAELGGILQWAIQGCVDWQRDGMETPDSVRDASAEYFVAQDALGGWLDERTESKKTAQERSSSLYSNYKDWCEQNGEYQWVQREFSQKVLARGFTNKKVNGIMHIVGLQLKDHRKFAR